ncbi:MULTISPECIES: carbohydrate ABC transporter permease [unclassified Enterococcus]|uniref:carbohydrate ABC transporter permease n=1 Tax=unclassified Enterococcus TaxID=2608891 RepID=UPI0015570AAF|nr:MULTISPECIES: carbohydrate ABC transporter permease [unclassified Enterococcus]MBS7578157.1 carbohydrate ABC transporter permease [Enterococcus sp. MMGLQ5-2]MBS7584027.1 carbohydrate ABC transporter permease [Enterococcus sp. MMGLQ5-1]NPD11888.1 carbohydrate ABC transporter permease [Enterococcus sp. MMGLQ5-1]NPD37988.1 carbohydrate ABC transporter permease [Enterococcus sp. MMGLQ5-2]
MMQVEKNKSSITKKKVNFQSFIRYFALTAIAFFMLYPILWLIGSSFKANNTAIFTSISFIPDKIDFTPYVNGWQTNTEYTFTTFFINTFKIVIPRIVFVTFSSAITAYGFSRFSFPGKKILFGLLISTLFLPGVVTQVPMYLLWSKIGMLDTYVPLVSATLFAQNTFYVFMLIQFMRGIPRDLDEVAIIDGCGPFKRFYYIILPLMRPSLIAVGLFEFMSAIGDFMGPLIYISSVDKYPISLALKMAVDTTSSSANWNQILAMSIISLIPSIVVFFSAQKYFVEGISTSGMKG